MAGIFAAGRQRTRGPAAVAALYAGTIWDVVLNAALVMRGQRDKLMSASLLRRVFNRPVVPIELALGGAQDFLAQGLRAAR
jgi:hypothetical protein